MLAEEVVLIEEGQVRERGSHTELLERKGAYYSVFQDQFQPQMKEANAQPASSALVEQSA